MSRTGLASRLLVVCLALLVANPIVVPPKAEATPPGQDIRYTYDGAGRLTSVRDAATDTARYRYDATGNITSIARGPSSATTIVEFSPDRGPAGTSVTIFGTGFGVTPGDNTVTFNGATATVQSAAATELVVTVPGSASTGPIQVIAPGGSSISADPFTIAPDPAPTLATVTPTNAAAGDLITVTGTNLASTADAAVNQLRATVESAAATSATFRVPAPAGSGRVRLVTPYGRVTGPDLFIAPAPYTGASIAFGVRTSIGQGATGTIATSGQIGLIIFDGTAGQRISIKWGTVQASLQTSLYNPDGSQLIFFNWTGSSAFFDTITLPTTGTYSLLLDPNGSATGTSTLTAIYNVPSDVATTTTIGGSPVSLTITAPGQNGRITFPGTANQRISIKWGTVQASLQTSLLNPDGSQLVFFNWTGSNQFFDTLTLPTTGTYTLFLNPNGAATGTSTLTKIHDVPADATASTTVGGSPVSLTITVPGQNGRITFAGAANQRISIKWGTVQASLQTSLLKPDGSQLVFFNWTGSNQFFDTLTLPVAGTYTLLLTPMVTRSARAP